MRTGMMSVVLAVIAGCSPPPNTNQSQTSEGAALCRQRFFLDRAQGLTVYLGKNWPFRNRRVVALYERFGQPGGAFVLFC